MEILRGPWVRNSDLILSRRGIEPQEQEAVSNQLQRLQSYGLVDATPRGWIKRE